MDSARLVSDLEDALPKLSPDDRKFGRSLIDQFNAKNGSLSDKQMYWVVKLTERSVNPNPAPKQEQVGSFSGVMSLFAKAKENLKYPKINLAINTQPIQLSLSGPASKYPGQVNVTDGGPFQHNTWFGRVDTAGNWTQSRSADDQELKDIRRFLQAFSKDPAKTASEYGRLSGKCCFCNSKLTDEKSTAVGFGPVCAKNYGLASEWKAASAVLETAVHA